MGVNYSYILNISIDCRYCEMLQFFANTLESCSSARVLTAPLDIMLVVKLDCVTITSFASLDMKGMGKNDVLATHP